MPHVVLQARDLKLLTGLFESRIMTLRHAAALYFGGREPAAKKRLQAIRRAGYVHARIAGPPRTQVFYLSARAHRLLADRRLLSPHPPVGRRVLQRRIQVSAATVRHELDVMSVKAALVPALAGRPGARAVEFWTWPRLFAFRAQRPVTEHGITRSRSAWMKPDGFLRVAGSTAHSGPQQAFYLEVDRGTETQQTLASKVAGYRDYLQSGAYARAHPDTRGFRVLMVFPSPERRNNAAESMLALAPPIRTLTWLTTLKELTADPLGPIWITPKDYRAAVDRTPFAPNPRHRGDGYVRRPAREAHVAATVVRRELFDHPQQKSDP